MPFHNKPSRMKKRNAYINSQELGMQLGASQITKIKGKKIIRTKVLVRPVPKHLRLKDGKAYKKNYKLVPYVVKGIIN